MAVTATSETYPERELDEAITTAKTIGINHLVIHSDELTDTVIDEIVTRLKGLGFTYVTLDLQGLRSGSMNEVLK